MGVVLADRLSSAMPPHPVASDLRVAPSILSADFGLLAEAVAGVTPASEWLHVDVMDGHFVPNLSMGPPVVASLRRHTDLFFDTHLMITDPDRYLESFRDAGSNGCTVHVEVGGTAELIAQMRELGLRVGLAANPDTPFEAVEPYLSEVDLVVCMTVFPGFAGQSFIAEVMPKVRQVRGRVGRSWPRRRRRGRRGYRPPHRGRGRSVRRQCLRRRLGGLWPSPPSGRGPGDPPGCGGSSDGRPALTGRNGAAGQRDTARRDAVAMGRAIEAAERVRGLTAPNPWVGAVVRPEVENEDRWFAGATAPAGGPHAEVVALDAAGRHARSGTLYVTLEPCVHRGRTPPCTDAVIASGIRRVVVGVEDPDPQVAGRGIDALRSAGLDVEVGVEAEAVADQLSAYLKHRRTGRPGVTLKLASTLDGFTAAPDGSSRWITGGESRLDVHRMRARTGAVLVGAGTIRADDPSLTVRLPPDDPYFRGSDQQPVRIVLGRAPAGAAVQPAVEMQGGLEEVLDQLGQRGVLDVLVEGGATVAHAFHSAGLVDRYVLYLAPALFGGDDGRSLFAGPGAPSLDRLWRGRLHSVTSLGSDLRVDLLPDGS